MKKTMKRILSIMLVVVMTIGIAPLSGFVGLELPEFGGFRKLADSVSEFFDGFQTKAEAVTSGTCGENLTWSFDESTGTLTISGTGDMTNYALKTYVPWYGYSLDVTKIEIGNNVTSVGDNAFNNCRKITSIIIPDSITNIGSNAFYYCERISNIKIGNSVTCIGSNAFYFCKEITDILIPDSVTNIGHGAFSYCLKLSNVLIPSGVENIGGNPFYNCSNLINISVDPDNAEYSNDEYGVLFNKEKTELLQYPIGNTRTVYTIPNSVTTIGCSAFEYSKLVNITIPDSVTFIEGRAFAMCSRLTSIVIPDSIKRIEGYTFYICQKLAKVTIGNSVTSIGDYAFNDCNRLVNITIPDSVTSIGECSFQSCDLLSSIIIPGSITSIGNRAFAHCTGLTKVILPETITNLGDNAFFNCDNLTNVTIPKSIKTIKYNTFASCKNLSSVTISDGVIEIAQYAFSDCGNLKDIVIPDSVKSLGRGVFSGCSRLTSIKISNSLVNLGDFTFSDCISLTSIEIPDNVTILDIFIFRGCYNLKSIIVPKSITSIGNAVFEDCTSLKDVYYIGTEEQWKQIVIGQRNECLTSATIHYNYVDENIETYNAIFNIKDENGNIIDKITVPYKEGETIVAPAYDKIGENQTFSSWVIPEGATMGTSDMVFEATLVSVKPNYIEGTLENVGIKVDYRYCDDYFLNSAYKYNHALAQMSIVLAASAMVPDGDTTNDNYATKKPDAAKKLFKEIGFADDSGEGYAAEGYNSKPTTNSIACVIASKNISDTETIIALAVRGGGYEWEWGGNFVVGNAVNHEGFDIAKNIVLGNLNTFIGENKSDLNGRKVTFWITGYSRSAATANLVTKNLVDASKGMSIGYNNIESLDMTADDIFAYCFETPRNTKDKSVSSSEYCNIFNIVNPIDPVPMVAPEAWEYDRYGVNCYIPSATGSDGYADYKNETSEMLKRIFSGEEYVEKFAFYEIQKEYLAEKYLEIITFGLSDYFDNDEEFVKVNESMGQGEFMHGLVDIIADEIVGSNATYVQKYQSVMVKLMPVIMLAESIGFDASICFGDIYEYTLKNIWKILFSKKAFVNGMIEVMISSFVAHSVKINHPEYPNGFNEDEVRKLFSELDDVIFGLVKHPNYLYTLIRMFALNKEEYSKLFYPHEARVTVAWMMSLDGIKTPEQINYRTLKFNCPVNIEIYDSDGALRASIINDEVQFIEGSYISTYINENGEKCFCLPNDGEYTFKVIGTDTGTMSYSVVECDGATSKENYVTNYNDIPVSKGTELNGLVEIKPEDSNVSKVTIADENNNVIEPSESFEITEEKECEVTIATDSESSSVLGGGKFYKGEYAKATAFESENEIFVGWYMDGKLVSTEWEYRFRVESDMSLIAVFESCYKIVWIVDGNKSIEKIKPGQEICLPDTPIKEGYVFLGWTPEVPETMPANDLTFTAEFEEIPVTPEIPKVVATIRTPSTTTINYGDSIWLHAEISGELPADAKFIWTPSNNNFEIVEVSADGLSCKITPKSNGTTTFTVSVVDANEKVLATDTQDMNSKAGFWQKIVAFFKKIFGATKTYPELYKVFF